MSADTLAGLLDAIGAAPVLPGARCRNRAHLFDEEAPNEDATERHAQAVGLCEQCPSLNRCETWFLGLPPRKRPPGIVAGRINQPMPTARPRKAVGE